MFSVAEGDQPEGLLILVAGAAVDAAADLDEGLQQLCVAAAMFKNMFSADGRRRSPPKKSFNRSSLRGTSGRGASRSQPRRRSRPAYCQRIDMPFRPSGLSLAGALEQSIGGELVQGGVDLTIALVPEISDRPADELAEVVTGHRSEAEKSEQGELRLAGAGDHITKIYIIKIYNCERVKNLHKSGPNGTLTYLRDAAGRIAGTSGCHLEPADTMVRPRPM